MSAKLHLGRHHVADIPLVHWSTKGVSYALASVLTREQYRRVFRGGGLRISGVVDGDLGQCIALIETCNDDGTRGPTYSLTGVNDGSISWDAYMASFKGKPA